MEKLSIKAQVKWMLYISVNTLRLSIFTLYTYEKVHFNLCRYTLGVNDQATSLEIFNESCRYPLMLDI